MTTLAVVQPATLAGQINAQPTCNAWAKCFTWTFLCLGCGLLSQSLRSDALTCSPACRVRAYRSGAAAKIRHLAQQLRIPTGSIVQCRALMQLRPDLVERISRGEIDLGTHETRIAMHREFYALVLAQLDAEVAA